MYGVVLWSDPNDERALIWCEDHGKLAFYRAEDSQVSMVFDEGDLVRFGLREVGDMRYAVRLEVVAAEEYPYLARRLQQASAMDIGRTAATKRPPAEGKVVPFAPRPAKPVPRRVGGSPKVASR